MIGAKMILEKEWSGKGVFNMENFDAKPFMEELNKQGLPWKIVTDLTHYIAPSANKKEV